MLPETDTGIYVASGLFTIAVFAVAIAAVVGRTVIGLTTRTVLTLSAGFLLFMIVYFVSMAVYRGIERGSRTE
jgi:high-affinity Fe2+/Pb2+ permease